MILLTYKALFPDVPPLQTNSGRFLMKRSCNTLWAVRGSFEIQPLRRLRLERSRESFSRSLGLVQSSPAHVARMFHQEPAASLFASYLPECSILDLTHPFFAISLTHYRTDSDTAVHRTLSSPAVPHACRFPEYVRPS